MVARGDAHRSLHAAQGIGKLLTGFPEHTGAVQQIACQQHQGNTVGIDVVCQAEHQFPALPAAGGGLLSCQGAESAVQMKVRPVDEFEHGLPPLIIFRSGAHSACQPLHTSTHSTKLEE